MSSDRCFLGETLRFCLLQFLSLFNSERNVMLKALQAIVEIAHPTQAPRSKLLVFHKSPPLKGPDFARGKDWARRHYQSGTTSMAPNTMDTPKLVGYPTLSGGLTQQTGKRERCLRRYSAVPVNIGCDYDTTPTTIAV
eukprot:scaffold8008_cov153-Amphora_coffeaeformis.AAC.4